MCCKKKTVLLQYSFVHSILNENRAMGCEAYSSSKCLSSDVLHILPVTVILTIVFLCPAHKRHQRFPPYDPTIYTVDKGEGGLSVPPTPTVTYVDPLSASGLSPKEAPFSARSGPDLSGAADPLAAFVAAVKVFVPRQRFILLAVQDKEVCALLKQKKIHKKIYYSR